MTAVAKLISSVLQEDYSPDGFVALADNADFLRIECTGGDSKLIGALLAIGEDNHTLRILFLVVRPAYQNQGLGQRAWAVLTEWAREKAFQSVVLEVRCSNASALSFYTHRGMNVVGRVTNYFGSEDAFRLSVRLV